METIPNLVIDFATIQFHPRIHRPNHEPPYCCIWKERNRTKREIRDNVFFMDRSSMVDGEHPSSSPSCTTAASHDNSRYDVLPAGMNKEKVGLLVDVSYGTKLWMVDLRSRDFRPNRIATKFKDALIRAGSSGRHKVIF